MENLALYNASHLKLKEIEDILNLNIVHYFFWKDIDEQEL